MSKKITLNNPTRNRNYYIGKVPFISKMTGKDEIKELSKQLNMPEEIVEKILEDVSKPSLANSHCSLDNEIGVGPSDKAN